MGRLVFVTLISTVAEGVLERLWPALRGGWRRWLLRGLIGLAVGAWVLPLLLGKQWSADVLGVGVPLKLFASAWLVAGILIVLVGLPIVLLSGRAASRRAASNEQGGEWSPPEGVDMGRRNLLGHLGRAVPVAAMATGVAGVVNGSQGFTVRREQVRLRNLPKALEGFTIGQITDVHVGSFIDADYVRRAVAAMNEAKVDLQVMTGDLIDDLTQFDDTLAALSTCSAPHGMLSILGNHEHWRGLPDILAGYRQLAATGAKVTLLVDEAHVLMHGEQKVRVVGVDYPILNKFSNQGKDVKMRQSADLAFEGAQADEFVMCLAHHPDFFPIASEKGARLTLSGHTHGGQVALFGVPVFGFVFKHMLGRYKRGDNHLYVSGGTGHWLPFRVGVPAEVTILTLRAA